MWNTDGTDNGSDFRLKVVAIDDQGGLIEYVSPARVTIIQGTQVITPQKLSYLMPVRSLEVIIPSAGPLERVPGMSIYPVLFGIPLITGLVGSY